MATKLRLPYARYVCQVSTGEPRPKSGYVAMMEENLTALQGCEWRKVQAVTSTLTPHDFTKASYFDDSYDAFKMTGAWAAATQTETAFAGMAAYVFKLPADYVSGAATLVGVSIPVLRDRFCLGGVRVAVALGSGDTPSGSWDVVRGAGAAGLETGLMEQSAVPYLTKSAPGNESITIDLSGTDSQAKPSYMIVYVTLENYTDHWEMYSAKEARNYAIEGSAMISGGEVEVEFSADVTADSFGNVVRVVDQFFTIPVKGLTGWVYALKWMSGADVEATDDNSVPAYGLVECHVESQDATTGEPYQQATINNLYAALELGRLYVGSSQDYVMKAGASFTVGVDATIESGALSKFRAVFLLAGSYMVPMRLPGFQVRRVTITWVPYKINPETGTVSEDTTNYVSPPNFSREEAQDAGYINIWIKDGAYVDAFEESLLKSPRIYDAAETVVSGWRLIGQIDYAYASNHDSITIDLQAPLNGPCATILCTAFVPSDVANFYNCLTYMTDIGDGTPLGVCPVTVASWTDNDPAKFVLSSSENKAFRPGIILEG